MIVYAFRKDGKPVAAIWHYQKRDGVKSDLSPFQVFDVYGNPVKPGVLPLTGTPYYLRPGTLSEAAFLEKLKTLSVLLDNPIGASPLVRLLNRDGEYSLLATLSNGSAADQTVCGFITTAEFSAFRLKFRNAARSLSTERKRVRAFPSHGA